MGAPWINDVLGRKKSADFLTKYLVSRYQKYLTVDTIDTFVLAINAEWGFGKSFLLQNWRSDLQEAGYPVVYFDAWQNDYTHEPLVSFIAEIEKQLLPKTSSTDVKKLFAKTIAGSKKFIRPAAVALTEIIIKRLTHLTSDELKEVYGNASDNARNNDSDENVQDDISSLLSKCADEALKEHKNIQESIKEFKENLTRLVEKIGKLESIKLPIFVLVDELDRCRPTFSIQLLENIKHLFGVPGVYFVIATNIDQLSHSVGAVYGTGFNSEGYLKRFFDQEYILPEPDNESYAEFLFEKHSIKEDPRYLVLLNTDSYGSGNFNVKTFSIISSFFKLGLRDQEQVANSLSAILLVWPHKHIHLTYILILLMAKHRSMQAYKKLVDSSFLGHEFAAGAFTQLDVDRSVRIKRMEFDFNNTRQENQSFLIDIFWQYHSNAMIDMRDLRKQNHSRSGFPAGTIIEGILLEMPNSYMSSQEFPSSLKTYSSIVNQVGDLLV